MRRITKPLHTQALLAAFTLLLLLGGTRCGSAETVSLGDAYVQIYVAIEYRASVCGARPTYPLLVFEDPRVEAVDLCTLAIAAEDCPFNDYPVICLELYNTDVPGYGSELEVRDAAL